MLQSLKNLLLLRVLLLAAAIGLTACAEQTQLSSLERGDTIVAFGDSLTAGVGANLQASYPQFLARLSGLKVINEGVSGETTEQGLARFEQVLAQHRPKLVLLLEGGNDILRNYDLLKTKQNLAQMIEMAQAQAVEVVLIGVPEKSLFSDSADLYKDLAQQYELVFEPEVLSNLLKKKQFKSDPIHLNGLGYEQLASRIFDLLEEHGAL